MADIVYLSPNNQTAGRVMSAIEQIRSGLAILQSFDGLRAEAIGKSPEQMAAIFGVEDAAQAQALSDRWAALLALYSEDAKFSGLRDFINATTWTV